MVTEKDGPIVMAMPDHPPNGLVHSPGCLLPVPVVPREELRGGREGLRHVSWSTTSPLPAPPLTWSPAPPSSTSHLAPSPALGLHLIQELHLKENPGVHAGWVRKACDDHSTAIHVCEVQSLTSLEGSRYFLPLSVSIKPRTFPKGPPVPEPSWPQASGMSRVKNPPTLNQAGSGVPGPHDHVLIPRTSYVLPAHSRTPGPTP